MFQFAMNVKCFIGTVYLFDLISTQPANEALIDFLHLGLIDLIVLMDLFCQDQTD